MVQQQTEAQKMIRVNDMYTSLIDAKEELQKRRMNEELKKEVEIFLDNIIPTPLQKCPKAVLARYIATPNLEFIRFLELSRTINMEPICLEYTEDKYCQKNPIKYCLCNLNIIKDGDYFFKKKFNKQEENSISISNNNNIEGTRIDKIKTIWGQSLVEFHHNMFNNYSCNSDNLFHESSYWVKLNGKHACNYYTKFIALFLYHGILFENFITIGSEGSFTEEVVLPGFQSVVNKFKIKPLIVRLLPENNESDESYWNSYIIS